MLYDFDPILNYPSREDLHDYDNMSEKEIFKLCLLRLAAFFICIAIIGIVCVIIHVCKS